jgi:hypothetical protein
MPFGPFRQRLGLGLGLGLARVRVRVRVRVTTKIGAKNMFKTSALEAEIRSTQCALTQANS